MSIKTTKTEHTSIVSEQLSSDPLCRDALQRLRQLAESEPGYQPLTARLDSTSVDLGDVTQLAGNDAGLQKDAATALALAAVFELPAQALVEHGLELMRHRPETNAKDLYQHLLRKVANGPAGSLVADLAKEMMAKET